MSDGSKKALLISFSDPPDDDIGGSGPSSSLSLDTDYNTALYGPAKIEFSTDEIAFLKFLTPGRQRYQLESSSGSITVAGTRIQYPVASTFMFVDADEAELPYEPVGPVGFLWDGPDQHPVRIIGRRVVVLDRAVGRLTCTYAANGDRIAVASPDVGTVLAAVIQASANYSLDVIFSDAAPGGIKTYLITVSSLCEAGVISGVAVTKDGAALGVTDGSGQLVFQSYPGIFTFEATHDSYVSVSSEVTLT